MNPIATIVKPGLSTTIQDLGRPGCRHLGAPRSGAADIVSLALANAVVGNGPNAAALECTLAGPGIRFEQQSVIAVTGADMTAHLNDVRIEPYTAISVTKGDHLALGSTQSGARAYLAFRGGLGGSVFLGSRSTYLSAGVGGHEGRALKAGDTLASADITAMGPREIPPSMRPAIGADFFLRAIPGPEFDQLPGGDKAMLFSQRWKVGRRADRMGAQLDGAALIPSTSRPMASGPVFPGTVQCPPDGAPFLLLADAQTIGGYPRIAQLTAADLPLAGQVKPGDCIWFWKTTPEEAQEITQKKAALLADFLPARFFC